MALIEGLRTCRDVGCSAIVVPSDVTCPGCGIPEPAEGGLGPELSSKLPLLTMATGAGVGAVATLTILERLTSIGTGIADGFSFWAVIMMVLGAAAGIWLAKVKKADDDGTLGGCVGGGILGIASASLVAVAWLPALTVLSGGALGWGVGHGILLDKRRKRTALQRRLAERSSVSWDANERDLLLAQDHAIDGFEQADRMEQEFMETLEVTGVAEGEIEKEPFTATSDASRRRAYGRWWQAELELTLVRVARRTNSIGLDFEDLDLLPLDACSAHLSRLKAGYGEVETMAAQSEEWPDWVRESSRGVHAAREIEHLVQRYTQLLLLIEKRRFTLTNESLSTSAFNSVHVPTLESGVSESLLLSDQGLRIAAQNLRGAVEAAAGVSDFAEELGDLPTIPDMGWDEDGLFLRRMKKRERESR